MKDYEIADSSDKLNNAYISDNKMFKDVVILFLRLIVTILIEILKEVRKTYSKLI